MAGSWQTAVYTVFYCLISFQERIQARNQDFMWGGANLAKVDQTSEMYLLFNSF